MITFTTQLKKFGEQGEKTGWTYIEIPEALAQQLNPGMKKSYRVKGKLDKLPIHQTALVPMGAGAYILAVNGAMRKQLKKQKGDTISVQLAVDDAPLLLSAELMACLEDEPEALQRFQKLAPSHQQYYNRYIESAKTPATKAKRISMTIQAMLQQKSFNEMLKDAANNKLL